MTDVYTPPANSAIQSGDAWAVVADNDVDSLSVSYGPFRSTETIWQQGAFCYPFLRSTRANARSFMVSRDGGWPAAPRFWINDPVVTPTGWDVLLDFDFTAQPDGPVHDSGGLQDYFETIGGIVWHGWYGGNATGQVYPQGQLNGVGYRLAGRSAAAYPDNCSGSLICMDHATLPGYVSGRRSCVLAALDAPQNVGANTRAWVGQFKPLTTTPSGTQTTVVNSGICGGYIPRLSYGNIGGCLGAQGARDKPTESQDTSSTPYQATLSMDTTLSVFGAIRVSDSEGQALFGPYDGSLPVVEHLKSAGTVDTVTYSSGGLQSGVIWSADFQHPFGYKCDIKRLIILQAKS